MTPTSSMIELNAPSTEMDWLCLILLIAVVYLVFRK